MIIVVFLVCSLYLPWTKGSSVHIVHQSPSALIKIHGSSVDQEIHCSHIINYDRMLWYKQDRNRTLILLGHLTLNYAYSEEYLKEKISLQGDGHSYGNLSISDLKSEDSRPGEPAYFGNGTKLTVLDPAINGTVNGTVKVLPPSTEECEARNKKKKKTLVCVATGFYPDHVTVFWQVNDHNRTEGAGTDNKALQNDNKLYSITSRLRVPAKEWHNPANRFTCNVIFYNEKGYERGNDTISGDLQGQSGEGMTREYYVKSTLTAKLAYSVFIAKSTFYGLVVMVLIWKFKGSSEKEI